MVKYVRAHVNISFNISEFMTLTVELYVYVQYACVMAMNTFLFASVSILMMECVVEKCNVC